jgi:hypothetical protein
LKKEIICDFDVCEDELILRFFGKQKNGLGCMLSLLVYCIHKGRQFKKFKKYFPLDIDF